MELSEIEELPKRLFREKLRCAFRLQASRAITVAERAKKAYDDDRAKVAKARKVLQDHANLVKDKEALERKVKATKANLSEMMETSDASIQAARDV
ncbi:hypothetical protein L3X38_002096 [Prunus dulcis]|uniref:Uncharacterized protein n=1 Tax=Prunus dulcis TaxID=3755 RepID=A0AAD4ZKJ0_PRUDU|nr:hypothetical protein L3X38_002096 [Prunus dulcis]